VEGDINLNGNQIGNSNQNPLHEDELVQKRLIETHFLSRNGGSSTMTSDLNMDGHVITYLKEPEHDHNAATKRHTNTKLSLEETKCKET